MTKFDFTNLLDQLGGLGGILSHHDFGRNRYGLILYPDKSPGWRFALVGRIRVKAFLESIIIHRFPKSGDPVSVQYHRHLLVFAKYKKWLDEWRNKNPLRRK